MTDVDLDRVKAVLRAATGPGGGFSMRGLAKAAGEGRDVVGDILNGRNRNPTLRVLANLARALGGDLTLFGVGSGVEAETRTAPPTAAELAQALRDVLPGLPRGSLDKRTEYLAEALSRALRLPQDPPATGHDAAPPPSPVHAAGAPPPATTS
jgi:transcriptional regulator with XRE-family HTH domain